MRRIKLIATIAGVATLVAVGLAALGGGDADAVRYRIAKIERGSIVKSVTASGKLNAVVTVQVGSQISGRVSELLVDFNAEVEPNQVIARIDPTTYEAKVREASADLEVAQAQVLTQEAAVPQARANLANARATLAASEADVVKSQISLADLELDLKRKRDLKASGAVAISAIDKAEAAWKTAVAQLNVSRAQLEAQRSLLAAREAAIDMAEADVAHARALVDQKSAVLNTTKVSLENTYIRSPVAGVVIGRDVDVGTVVAASLSAPTLFSIAQDLRSMQVETSIDEADIGQIVVGQPAIFTVDSFLGREFSGTVTQVRKQPLEQQNVVTYTVVISADNRDLRLLPGMTANVEIRVSDRTDVLKVPSAALRFRPPGGDNATPAAPAGSSGPGGGPVRDPSAQREQLDRLAESLNLDEAQKQKVAEITTEMFQRARAQRQTASGASGQGAGVPPAAAARTPGGAGLRERINQRIMAILTPAQQETFRALIAERRETPSTPARVWVLENGKPKQVQITIGVADASHAELIRGPLGEGTEVVVGIARQTSTRAGSSSGRFGF